MTQFLISLIFLSLSLSWDISNVVGDSVYISFGDQKIVVSASSFEKKKTYFGEREKLIEVVRYSRVFMEKQMLRKPTIYKNLIVDEESKIFTFKDGVTLFYGRIYLNIPSDVDYDEPEKIYFFRTPFFIRLLKGEVFIVSGDTGYFIYCIKCEGELWKEYEKVIEEKLHTGEIQERASLLKTISSHEVIFVSDNDYESDVGDDELRNLVLSSVERMNTKDKFLKDIIYSYSTDVPEPKAPNQKKFDSRPRENTKIPELREMMLIEKRCYELLKKGKECR